ncbi:Probable Co/Zn/Cd efflux system membrane fusion protein [hydrothermal vent metagenome]|uniref:Probable Co/Zn/Cd efflux system membrane fusion protein n=1 Tax=hydrothermal vent metagenome TaxID=652676 RepID=A0A3B0RAA8_9ZZZZ
MAAAILLALAGGYYVWLGRNAGTAEEQKIASPGAKPGQMSAEQIKRLGVKTVSAEEVSSIPLGNAPATVSLPPEARVAVTAPFNGAVIRLYVVEGQSVARGAPLAILKTREPVLIGAELARARGDLGLARANAARINQLAREGIVARARADEANAAVRQAQISVTENQRILSQAGTGSSGQMTLRAPIGGRVSAVNVQTGGPVDGMTAPFVIDNTSSYMLDIQLPERIANNVRSGMAIEVQMQAASKGAEPAMIGGTIISVSPELDPMTRSVMAKARIGAAPNMVAGKSVMVTILGDGDQSGVAVPAAAVFRTGEREYVFVKTRNGFQKREISRVAGADGNAIISTGLKAGEDVAVSGIAELKVILAEE